MPNQTNELPIWKDGRLIAFNGSAIDSHPETHAEIVMDEFRVDGIGTEEQALVRKWVDSTTKKRGNLCSIHAVRYFDGTCPSCRAAIGGADIDDPTPRLEAKRYLDSLGSDVVRNTIANRQLHVTCSLCTRQGLFNGWDRPDCVIQAWQWGWGLKDVGEETCPECSRIKPT